MLLCQHRAKIIMGLSVVRPELHGGLELFGGPLQVTLARQCRAEVILTDGLWACPMARKQAVRRITASATFTTQR